MTEKRCPVCKLTKDSSQFQKDKWKKSGLRYRCKHCASLLDRISYEKNREKKLKGCKLYETDEGVKRKRIKNSIERMKGLPLQTIAHSRVAYNIQTGKIKRLPCEVCGEDKSFAHHDDYNKPLDIRWLCRKHHEDYHKSVRMEQCLKDKDARLNKPTNSQPANIEKITELDEFYDSFRKWFIKRHLEGKSDERSKE